MRDLVINLDLQDLHGSTITYDLDGLGSAESEDVLYIWTTTDAVLELISFSWVSLIALDGAVAHSWFFLLSNMIIFTTKLGKPDFFEKDDHFHKQTMANQIFSTKNDHFHQQADFGGLSLMDTLHWLI